MSSSQGNEPDQPSSQNSSQKSFQKASKYDLKAGTPDQQKESQTDTHEHQTAPRPAELHPIHQISNRNAKPKPRSARLEPNNNEKAPKSRKARPKSAAADVRCTFLARSRHWCTHSGRRRAPNSRTPCSVASACFSRRPARAHLLLQLRLFSPRGRSGSREFSRTRGVHEQVR